MLRFFTDLINPEQSFTERLSAAIENIGPDFFLVYSPSKTLVSKNIWILLSIINDEVGCYRNLQRQVTLIQLINYVATKRDRKYLGSKDFPLQHTKVEDKQFYSQYINPVVFYLMSKNSTLYKSSEAKMLLSYFKDLDVVKFDIVKKFIKKFLDISTDEAIDAQMEEMLSQKKKLTCVTDQVKTDPSFAQRYNAILLYEEFIKLLALADHELENLKETFISIPESKELVAAFACRFSKLKNQRDEYCSKIYDLKTSEKFDELCVNFFFHFTEVTNLREEIKGYQFSKDQLVLEIQKQKLSFRELIPQIKIPVDLTRSEERKGTEQRPDREKLEDELLEGKWEVLEGPKSLLVEKALWEWYSEYATNHVEIKLSEESAYEDLVDAYKENQLILEKLSKLRDFFNKLQLCENQYEQSVQQQIIEKLLGLLSETVRNKIISINHAIEPLQILFCAQFEYLSSCAGTVNLGIKSKHLNSFIEIVNLVIETAEMWLRNVRGKGILSLSVDDISRGMSNVERLDKVKGALSEFLMNSGLWDILKELRALEGSLQSKKKGKEDLRNEMNDADRNKKLEFIRVLDSFGKGVQQKIPHGEHSNVMILNKEYVGVRIGNITEKIGLFEQVLNKLSNIKGRFEKPFAEWIQEIQTLLESQEDFGKLKVLLQDQLCTLRMCCDAFKKDFATYSKTATQRLEELNNEISELGRQQQEIQNTLRTMISNLDEMARSVDFGLEDEKKDNDYGKSLRFQAVKSSKEFDQRILIIEEMFTGLLNKSSEVEKYIKDFMALKASREKCSTVLECANLPPGVLDCLCDCLRMCVEAVTALSENMVLLEAKLSPQQEVLETNFSI